MGGHLQDIQTLVSSAIVKTRNRAAHVEKTGAATIPNQPTAAPLADMLCLHLVGRHLPHEDAQYSVPHIWCILRSCRALWFLQQCLPLEDTPGSHQPDTSAPNGIRAAINVCMTLLGQLSQLSTTATDDGTNRLLEFFAQKAQHYRQRLDAFVTKYDAALFAAASSSGGAGKKHVEKRYLGPLRVGALMSEFNATSTAASTPTYVPQDKIAATLSSSVWLSQGHELGGQKILPSQVCALFSKLQASPSSLQRLQALSFVEDFLAEQCLSQLLKCETTPAASATAPPPTTSSSTAFSVAELGALISLVNNYRALSIDLEKTMFDQHIIVRLPSEWRSRRILVVVAAYALAHRSVDRHQPDLELASTFSIPLDVKNCLSFLRLSDGHLTSALLAMCTYLEKCGANAETALFSLQDFTSEGLQHLADHYADLRLPLFDDNLTVEQLLEEERKIEAKREENHQSRFDDLREEYERAVERRDQCHIAHEAAKKEDYEARTACQQAQAAAQTAKSMHKTATQAQERAHQAYIKAVDATRRAQQEHDAATKAHKAAEVAYSPYAAAPTGTPKQAEKSRSTKAPDVQAARSSRGSSVLVRKSVHKKVTDGCEDAHASCKGSSEQDDDVDHHSDEVSADSGDGSVKSPERDSAVERGSNPFANNSNGDKSSRLRAALSAAKQELTEAEQKLQDARLQMKSACQKLEDARLQTEEARQAFQVKENEQSGAESAYSRTSSSLKTAQRNLAAAEDKVCHTGQQRLPPLLHRLPSDTTSARRLLFIGHCPLWLRQLGHLAFRAQQLCLAEPKDAPAHTHQYTTADQWLSKYEEHRYDSPAAPFSDFFPTKHDSSLTFCGPKKPNLRGKPAEPNLPRKPISSYTSSSDNVYRINFDNDGDIFRPTACYGNRVITTQAATSCRDPMYLTPLDSALPCCRGKLDWILTPAQATADSVDHTRANRAISKASHVITQLHPIAEELHLLSPASLQPSAVSLGLLRADTHTQFIQLCTLLQDANEAVFESELCQLVIRSAVYHTGPLLRHSESLQLICAWRQELMDGGQICKLLHKRLQAKVQWLASAPRQIFTLRFFGELAAFMAQTTANKHADFSSLADTAAKIAEDTALEQEKLMNKAIAAGVAENSNEYRLMAARRCVLLYHALCCFSFRKDMFDNPDNFRRLVRLILLSHDARPLIPSVKSSPQVQKWQGFVDQASQAANFALLRTLRHLSHHMDTHPELASEALTQAFQAIIHCEDGLSWKRLTADQASSCNASLNQIAVTAAFQATDTKGTTYTVDLASGTLLVQGEAPGRLPKEITNSELYGRVFGSRSFAVVKDGNSYITTAQVDGCQYRFVVPKITQAAPLIYEVHKGSSTPDMELRLLDAKEDWAKDLPPQLRIMYSFWLWESRDVIVLRGPFPNMENQSFLQRSVHFLFLHYFRRAGPTECRRVPLQERDLPLSQLLDRCNQMDLLLELTSSPSNGGQTNVTFPVLRAWEILQRVERKEFLQLVLSADKESLRLELPRYGKETGFHVELNRADATIRHLELRHYVLDDDQHMAGGALRGYDQYIKLKWAPLSTEEACEPGQAEKKLLVPRIGQGVEELQRTSFEAFHISFSDSPSAKLEMMVADLHPRFYWPLVHSSVDRLQLAYLFACTSTLHPEPGLDHMTGHAMALALARQSHKYQPFSSAEQGMLDRLWRSRGAVVLSPALRLLCHALVLDANKVAFLFADGDDHPPASIICLDKAAATAYAANSAEHLQNNVTERLTTAEERLLFNTTFAADPNRFRATPALTEAELQADLKEFYSFEARITECMSTGNKGSVAPEPKEDAVPADTSALQTYFAKRLERSRAALDQLQTSQVNWTKLSNIIEPLTHQISQKRESAEQSLQDLYKQASSGCALQCAAELQQATLSTATIARCVVEPHTLAELMPAASPGQRRRLLLSAMVLLHWMVLEDRVSRIHRLCRWGAEQAMDDASRLAVESRLEREVGVKRVYNVLVYPRWLVYEAEQGLQIRQQQVHVVEHLLKGNGVNLRFNMGEGKTAVLVPLMLLALTDSQRPGVKPCIPRIFWLPQLLHQCAQSLASRMTSSVFNFRLLMLPFHRQKQVSAADFETLRRLLKTLPGTKTAVVVSPSEVLSMTLRHQELMLPTAQAAVEDSAAICAALNTILHKQPYADILDESDELLRYYYQLIYTVGEPVALPHHSERCLAVRSLLKTVNDTLRDSQQVRKTAASQELAEFLRSAADGKFLAEADVKRPASQYCSPRFMEASADLETKTDVDMKLAQHVWQAFLEDVPPELQWLADLSVESKTALGKLVVDPAACCLPLSIEMKPDLTWLVPALEVLQAEDIKRRKVNQSSVSQQPRASAAAVDADAPAMQNVGRAATVLALRGLLAGGLLVDALRQRVRVTFGLDRRHKSPTNTDTDERTLMAVPYRATDTPDDRSEFAHPDRALMLTYQAYYHDGLTEAELRDLIRWLQGLSPTQQEKIFASWMAATQEDMSEAERSSLSAVNQVDLENSLQWETLSKHFRLAMPVIDCFVEHHVVPRFGRQFPRRLQATPWDLTAGLWWRTGFSGTDDTELLLPKGLRPAPLSEWPDLKQLHATEAGMHELICRQSEESVLRLDLAAEDAGDENPHSAECAVPTAAARVVKAALANGCTLILDAGALLLGVTPHQLAKHICDRLRATKEIKGVTYAERDATTRQWSWKVMRKEDYFVWSKASAPVATRDTFAVYGQAMCRGADLRLKPLAKALLTLGPSMCTDTLLQAAGRLRQLQTQRLVLAAPHNIWLRLQAMEREKMLASNAPTVATVLRWTSENTVRYVELALPRWAGQGLHRALLTAEPHRPDRPECFGLADLYSKSTTAVRVREYTDKHCGLAEEHLGGLADGASMTAAKMLVQQIKDHCAQYASEDRPDAPTVVDQQDEELERESELEREIEQEKEVELSAFEPSMEITWGLRELLTCLGGQNDDFPREAKVRDVAYWLHEWDLDNVVWATVEESGKSSCRLRATQNAIRHFTDGKVAFGRKSTISYVGFVVMCFGEDDLVRSMTLLSPLEAGNLLRACRQRDGRNAGLPAGLTHVSCLIKAMDAVQKAALCDEFEVELDLWWRLSGAPSSAPVLVKFKPQAFEALQAAVARLQLLNGNLKFDASSARFDGPRVRLLREVVLPNAEARHEAYTWACDRGLSALLRDSHLKFACQ